MNREEKTISIQALRDALRPPPRVVPNINTTILVYTVVERYGNKYNHYLPPSLLKELARMTPDAFMDYVHKKLTPSQIYELMSDEWQRRKSFMGKWPHKERESLSAKKMAQAGFYYLNKEDSVQCPFCRGILNKWKKDDVPIREHASAFGYCKFPKGFDCGNRPHVNFVKKNRSGDREIATNDFHIYPQTNDDDQLLAESFGILTEGPREKRLAPLDTRLQTFRRWPEYLSSISKEKLAEAGFYYQNIRDVATCFHCDGCLKGWKNSDDPWVEHARWFPNCDYLLHSKGEDFVEAVHTNNPPSRSALSTSHREPTLGLGHATAHNNMVRVCLTLGHSQESIDKAAAYNKEPFDNVSQLIDVIHQIENGELGVEPEEAPCQMESPPEDTPANCKPCQQERIERSATYIGLPCGHLIFCDNCAETAKTKAQRHLPITCPAVDCGSTLLGAMKTFLS